MRIRFGGAAAALAVVAAASLGPVAVAGAAPTGGAIKVWVTPSPTGTSVKHPGKILLTGAIGDYGTTISVNAAGKPAKHGTYVLLKLKKGTILVDVTTLNSALDSAKPTTVSSTNCSATLHATSSVSLVKGTGTYAGISGTIAMTLSLGAIARKTKSGACTFKTTSPVLATYTSFIGTGTVSFS